MMILLTFLFESKRQRRKRTLLGISSYRLVVLASIISSYAILLLLSGILELNLVEATQELNQETFDQLMKSGTSQFTGSLHKSQDQIISILLLRQ